MTIIDVGLLFGLTFALTILQLALVRIPLRLTRSSDVRRRVRIVASHVLVAALLFAVLLYANAAPEVAAWIAQALAFATGLSIDLAVLRLRRRRFVLAA